MKIKPEISEATDKTLTSGGKEYTVPKVTTSEAETSVTIKDGVTIIIGGLTKDKRVKTVNKIPILGDIPLMGFFFRKTEDKLEKTELVILLTPHIITGEKSITDFSEIKPTEGAVARMEKGNIIKEKISLPEAPESFKKELTPMQYYSLLSDRINQSVQNTFPRGRKGNIELFFSLSHSGELLGEPRILKITDENLIPLASKALNDACPFPPFPESIKKEREDFHIIISYE